MDDATMAHLVSDQRPRLIGLAYRIVGTRDDAEDLAQEALARLSVAQGVEDPRAWLTTVVTRLSIDHLRLARVQREAYPGPWLPEPVAGDEADPETDALMAESVATAMLVVLEALSPLERTVFVLHDVFGYAFEEVAAMLARSPAAVRKAASRARQHVAQRRPRFEPEPARRAAVVARFIDAASGGDLAALVEHLAPDVVFRSDGGGVVTAARRVLHGRDRVMTFLAGLARLNAGEPHAFSRAWVNECPAVEIRSADGALRTLMVIQVDGAGQVCEINAVLNPAKLSGYEPAG